MGFQWYAGLMFLQALVQVHIIRVINKPFFDVTVVIVSQYCLWICIKDNDLGTSDNIRLCFLYLPQSVHVCV